MVIYKLNTFHSITMNWLSKAVSLVTLHEARKRRPLFDEYGQIGIQNYTLFLCDVL